MNEIKTSCASTDQKWNTWDSIDWNKCEIVVNKLQARIVKAQKAGKHNKVKALQWVLTHSFYAKALAVKRVTSNSGSDTAGVDKVTWSTPNAKFKAISELKRRGYTPQPLRRVHIKKSTSVRNSNHEGQSHASIVFVGTGTCVGNDSRYKFLWFSQRKKHSRRKRTVLLCPGKEAFRPMGIGRRH